MIFLVIIGLILCGISGGLGSISWIIGILSSLIGCAILCFAIHGMGYEYYIGLGIAGLGTTAGSFVYNKFGEINITSIINYILGFTLLGLCIYLAAK